MKIRKISLAVVSLAALVLEALPFGAVCNFANPEGEPFRQTYSYFSLVPYGYANFGPFITALLTVFLAALCIIYIFFGADKMKRAIIVVGGAATAISLTPLLYGISFFSLVGGFITVTLAAATALAVIPPKE